MSQTAEILATSDAVENLITTCPRDCYDACGIRVVKQNGVILKVMGDPNHPHNRGTLCGKCTLAYNGAWRDPAARLNHPLRRTGAKGEGRFETISWNDALAEIAGRLHGITADGPGDRVIQTHYTGTFSLIGYGFPLRFFNRLGATEVDPDTVCNKAGHVVLGKTFGTSMDGFDPRTIRDAACVLVWGANPSASAPHAHRHWLAEAPGKVIVIDPIRHPTAESADLHLQPFPGTDAALAFALLHVIERDGLLDHAFLGAHTIGWDEVQPQIAACTPEWGESVTGVPAGLIVEAAHIYGRGPSMLWFGQGLQRQKSGGNVFRACALLPVATGNLGKPGTGILYLNGTSSRGIADAYIPAPHLRSRAYQTPPLLSKERAGVRSLDPPPFPGGERGLGGEGFPVPPAMISHMDLAECLEDPDRSKALFCWNNNIVASCPQQARLRRALEREDLFTVSIDLFPTDTVDYADIVLPAAGFLEFDDLVMSYFHYSVSAQVKVMDPIGESLPNQEIFRRLARAMGYTEPELFESDESMLAEMLRQTGLGLDFAGLSKRGTVWISDQPVIPFAGGEFPTPSGKVEIAGPMFVDDGMPSAPQPWADARPTGGRLRLLSPASEWRMNSSYDNVEKLRRRTGPADVWLNRRDAISRGLTDGARIVLANAAGRLPVSVVCSDIVPAGVALVHKGRWPKLDPSHANVNILNPGHKTDVGESSSVHSVEVEIVT